MTTESWVRGDWMQTYSGRRFYPLDPRPEEIHPDDIAHALSLLCRYGGHVDRFYSVAEHCVLMSYAVPEELALLALLHDATEAYVVDVPRPLKLLLPDYRHIEARVWIAISSHFRLDVTVPTAIKLADSRILIDEKRALFRNSETWGVELDMDPLGVEITGWHPERAEDAYLHRLEQLTRRV